LLLLSPEEIFIGRTSNLVHIFFYWSYFPTKKQGYFTFLFNMFIFMLSSKTAKLPTKPSSQTKKQG
jgi:hypothetical protein